MSKKVYVHVEIKDGTVPVTTFGVPVASDSTVASLQDSVAKHLGKVNNQSFEPRSVVLSNEHGKAVAKSGTVALADVIEDHEGAVDFFIFSKPNLVATNLNAPSPPSSSTKAASESTETKKPTPAAKDEVSAKSTPTAAAPAQSLKAEVLEAHRKLEENMKKKLYQKCKPLAELLIQQNTDASFAHNSLALIGLETKDFDQSIRHAKNAVQADRTNPNSYYIMGKAFVQKGQFEDAVDILDKGVKVWKARSAVTAPKDRNEHLCLDMISLQAEAMFADGDHNEAANLLNSLMGNPHCDRNVNVLVTYASFAFQYRKLEEAVVAFLKSIALKQPDPRITKLAVDILTSREGFQEFMRQFPPNMPESAEVYAFLGTLVKEMSAMDTSVVLYQIATRLQPENPSYILNLVHVLEVKQSLDESLDLLRSFYTKNASMGFRQQQSSNAIAMDTTCARMLEAMQPPSSSSGRRCQITWVVESPANHHRGFAQVEQVPVDSDANTATANTTTVVTANDEDDDAPSSDAETSLSRGNSSGSLAALNNPFDDPDHHMYPFVTRELDLIALYATTVKVFYLKGLLSHLPTMITLIERIRAKSQVALHETLVRNELAYYQDIVQILSVRSHVALYGLPDVSFALNDPLKSNKPEWVQARQRPLYLCGDSHCLSGGWSILDVHSLPRLVIPKLVTGVKHWHLRPESKFYPKENFLQTIASIPLGSEVIFVLGEIDCREGLLTALERGLYPSLEEAMKQTIGIFVKMVKDLKRSRKFRVRFNFCLSLSLCLCLCFLPPSLLWTVLCAYVALSVVCRCIFTPYHRC